jgi:hypothetical protein
MSNTSKGYVYTLTARIQKTTKKLSTGLAYTFSKAENAAEGGSTASSLWSAATVSTQDPNAANLGLASYYQPHRLIGNFSYSLDEGKYLSTSFGAIYELTTYGNASYVYNGDLNGDGNTGNDLIYIPKTINDIFGITKYFSYLTRQVSLPHDYMSNGFFTKKGRVCLVKFFVV